MKNTADLINIITDKFELNIKGQPCHPQVTNILKTKENKPRARLQVNSYQDCQIQQISHYVPEKKMVKKDFTGTQTCELPVVPFFFEEQDYQITIIARNEKDALEFYHDNPLIRKEITPLPGKNNILTGSINFKSDIGYS